MIRYRRFHRDYCWMDGYATGGLRVKIQADKVTTEQSKLTKTSIHDLLFHGQQKKTWNQLVDAAYKNGWLLCEDSRKRLQDCYAKEGSGLRYFAYTLLCRSCDATHELDLGWDVDINRGPST